MSGTIRNHWRADFSASPGSPSAPALLPRRFGTGTGRVVPGASGTAEFQFTLDAQDAVISDPDGANWETWDPGPVSVSTTRTLLSAVSAVRLVAYSEPATGQFVVSFDF